jgi:hypothetical protein
MTKIRYFNLLLAFSISLVSLNANSQNQNRAIFSSQKRINNNIAKVSSEVKKMNERVSSIESQLNSNKQEIQSLRSSISSIQQNNVASTSNSNSSGNNTPLSTPAGVYLIDASNKTTAGWTCQIIDISTQLKTANPLTNVDDTQAKVSITSTTSPSGIERIYPRIQGSEIHNTLINDEFRVNMHYTSSNGSISERIMYMSGPLGPQRAFIQPVGSTVASQRASAGGKRVFDRVCLPLSGCQEVNPRSVASIFNHLPSDCASGNQEAFKDDGKIVVRILNGYRAVIKVEDF